MIGTLLTYFDNLTTWEKDLKDFNIHQWQEPTTIATNYREKPSNPNGTTFYSNNINKMCTLHQLEILYNPMTTTKPLENTK